MIEDGPAKPNLSTDVAGPELAEFPSGPPLEGVSPDSRGKIDLGSAAFVRFGVVASVLVHLLLVLWLAGSFVSAEKIAEDEAIPVTLVPDEADPTPPPAPPKAVAHDAELPPPRPRSRSVPPSPPMAADDIRPAKVPTPDEDQNAKWSNVLAAAGMAAFGHPTTLTKDELNALSAQAKRCWNIPSGWTDPRQISVTVRFHLNRDGTLDGAPAVVQFPASELGKAAAINAVRAVVQCGPFKLPADKYDQWNDVQLRFAP